MKENFFLSKNELEEKRELQIKNGTYNFKNESICPQCNRHDIFAKAIVETEGEKREFLYCHYCHVLYVYKFGFFGRKGKPFLKAHLLDIAGFANLMYDVTEDIQQGVTYRDILMYGLQLPDPFPDFLLNNKILIEDEYGLKTFYNEYYYSGVFMTGVYGEERDYINRSYRIKQKVKNKQIPIVTKQDEMRLNEYMPWKKFL
ncbi:MAG: hypothetical protein QG567_1937 [Campylobacterota bacterium]|nr:hypothetical protein [Campylobacterota bacterium]